MKFVWYWEWDPEEMDKERQLSEKFEKAVKANPKAFPKLGESCHTGRGQGFRLVEAENEEQLMNLVVFWWPTENWELVPYFHGSNLVKAMQKWHGK